VRALRGEFGIPAEKELHLSLRFEAGYAHADFIRSRGELLKVMCNASAIDERAAKPEGSVALVCRGLEVYPLVREAVDMGQLAAKLEKDAAKEAQYCQKARAKLSNEGFTASAPAEIVAREREKLAEAERRAAKLAEYVKELRS
jgi:valyl-tRNA synthetase